MWNTGRTKRETDYKDDPNYKKPICPCCGKTYPRQQDFFFKNSQSLLWKGNNGFLPVCKSCVLDLYEKYKEELGSSSAAMQMICAHFDMYYSDETLNSAKKLGNSYCSSYFARKNLGQVSNKTYIDNIKETIANKVTSLVSAEDKNVDEETVKFWGVGYTPEEYQTLNDEYSGWVVNSNNGETPGKSLETVFKQACKLLVDLQRARNGGNVKDISSLSKSYLDFLASAGLKPIQEENSNIAENNSLGALIEKWEETEPVPEPSKEFKDVDGIKHYIDVWFKGHLAKMFGIQNDSTLAYEEEINKYKVTSDDSDSSWNRIQIQLTQKYNLKLES